MALGNRLRCSPPPTQIAQAHYLILNRPRMFYSLINIKINNNNHNTRPLHVVYASTSSSLDKAAHPLILYPTSAACTQTRASSPITHPLTRRESSVGRDRRVPGRQPQVSPPPISQAIVSCFNYQGYLSVFPSDFAVSMLS